ncbi:MAG TPA: twin-arginine translocation signal domain-containing protein [Ferruginibacter sp.]|nr:twin-arginine translocation signal domain-containing protein [Ferruginibacter sp.]
MNKNETGISPRRKFLGTIATGAAALGLSTLGAPSTAHAGMLSSFDHETGKPGDPDEWFNQVKGKHRMVFDVVEPKQGHESILPFAWPKVFLLTNAATGTPEKENSAVVILRHNAIPYAMEDRLWAKYKFGEFFNIKDDTTDAPSVRNRFWKPNPGYSVPGVGPVPIGINELQESGVMFCVCSMAINVISAVVAGSMKMKHEDVKNDWISGILPGIQQVPSGLWAVGRAQEHKCAYVHV